MTRSTKAATAEVLTLGDVDLHCSCEACTSMKDCSAVFEKTSIRSCMSCSSEQVIDEVDNQVPNESRIRFPLYLARGVYGCVKCVASPTGIEGSPARRIMKMMPCSSFIS